VCTVGRSPPPGSVGGTVGQDRPGTRSHRRGWRCCGPRSNGQPVPGRGSSYAAPRRVTAPPWRRDRPGSPDGGPERQSPVRPPWFGRVPAPGAWSSRVSSADRGTCPRSQPVPSPFGRPAPRPFGQLRIPRTARNRHKGNVRHVRVSQSRGNPDTQGPTPTPSPKRTQRTQRGRQDRNRYTDIPGPRTV
jgi:hypothetical protein